MRKKNYMSWDMYFMAIAILSSLRSKDPKTQNGACIASSDNRVIGIGYNGLPRGCDDDHCTFWSDEDGTLKSKHNYVVHAEQNAIYNSMPNGTSGSVIYTTQFPCTDCAQGIIQVGIKEVVFLYTKEHHHMPNEAVELMFKSSGVSFRQLASTDAPDYEFLQKLSSLKLVYEGGG